MEISPRVIEALTRLIERVVAGFGFARLTTAVVASVDGATVSLSWGAGSGIVESADVLSSYSPVVGDAVWVLVRDPRQLVLGKAS